MKKLHRFIFCLMLSCQAVAGLLPVFRMQLNTKPPIYVQEECPCDDVRKTN